MSGSPVRAQSSVTSFFRLLRSDDKAAALGEAIDALHHGERADGITYQADPHSFHQVPGSPFAYWVSDALRRKFTELPRFEGDGRTVKQGLATADDFRFVRAWWEVLSDKVVDAASGPRENANEIAIYCRGRTYQGCPWAPFAKGGEYSTFYSDIHLLVNWERDGAAIRSLPGLDGRIASRPQSVDYYFRQGITWSDRTTRLFSARTWNAGGIFSVKGSAGFCESPLLLPKMLGLMNSLLFNVYLSLMVGAGDAAARSYQVGTIGRVTVPDLDKEDGQQLGKLAIRCVCGKRALDTLVETSHAFTRPALLQVPGSSLAERAAAWQAGVDAAQAVLARSQREIDEIAYRLYGIADEDRSAIEESLGSGAAEATNQAEAADEDVEEEGAAPSADRRALVAGLVSYALGCAFGRWDVRLALDHALVPKLQGPFDPLPVCSPGMLVGPDALPATPEHIVSEEWLRARPDAITVPTEGSVRQPSVPEASYPLRIAWDGVLVDDPEHPSDLVRRVREVLALLWPDGIGAQAEGIEREACELLGLRELRDYFAKPAGFFADHLKRYSKSRRQAPIYWSLSTASGSYALWLSYHRLTSDTVFTAVNRYVEPKLAGTERRLGELTGRLAEASGREAKALREEVEVVMRFRDELRAFRDELLRVAQLPYRTNLDDGVIINAAPLHALFRNRDWAKATRECWQRLQRGDYDWAHLAYTLWPERVHQKCRSDKSLAIAHDREDLYDEHDAAPTTRGRASASRRAGNQE